MIWVTGDRNVKEACEAFAWDMVDSGLQVCWKDHQSDDFSAQVLLMNVPPVLDRGSVKNKIIWHLTKIEKGFLTGDSHCGVCRQSPLQAEGVMEAE